MFIPRVLCCLIAAFLICAAGTTASASAAIRTGLFGEPGQPVVSPDGRFAYVGDAHALLTLQRDQSSGALALIDAIEANAHHIATLSPDGAFLYLAGEYGVQILRRDAVTGKVTPAGTWVVQGTVQDFVLSADGRFAYATAGGVIYSLRRDPSSGVLSTVNSMASGAEYTAAGALALAGPVDSQLYAGSSMTIVQFQRDPVDGGLSLLGSTACSCADGLLVSANGTRLFTGPFGPSSFDRDPATGALAASPDAPLWAISTGWGLLARSTMLETPDRTGLFAIDHGSGTLVQFAVTATGISLVRTYHDGPDGAGLRGATGMAWSPDGRFLYVGGRTPMGSEAGTVAVFARDPLTDQLTYVSLYHGPDLEGGPIDAPPPVPSASINGGALYTNNPLVTLTLTGGYRYEVSNDGGFGRSSAFYPKQGGLYSWELASTGPEKLPKTVYVRVYLPASGQPVVVSDDIVLDQTVPSVVSASVTRSLRVRARDARSGVAKMQVTRNRSHPGSWRRFRSKSAPPRGHRKLYVRVADGAGNVSRWHSARKAH